MIRCRKGISSISVALRLLPWILGCACFLAYVAGLPVLSFAQTPQRTFIQRDEAIATQKAEEKLRRPPAPPAARYAPPPAVVAPPEYVPVETKELLQAIRQLNKSVKDLTQEVQKLRQGQPR
ncbi:MAG: hypothetical protein AB1646_21470 [Thermodesulfobacteriota bacterium]